jgi:hypothetical protein
VPVRDDSGLRRSSQQRRGIAIVDAERVEILARTLDEVSGSACFKNDATHQRCVGEYLRPDVRVETDETVARADSRCRHARRTPGFGGEHDAAEVHAARVRQHRTIEIVFGKQRLGPRAVQRMEVSRSARTPCHEYDGRRGVDRAQTVDAHVLVREHADEKAAERIATDGSHECDVAAQPRDADRDVRDGAAGRALEELARADVGDLRLRQQIDEGLADAGDAAHDARSKRRAGLPVVPEKAAANR